MSFSIEVFSPDRYPEAAAARISKSLAGSLVLTGGTTAEKVYGALAGPGADLASLKIFFSDERCVPPDSDASNYKMANSVLELGAIHRMQGEDEPEAAAIAYHQAVAPVVLGGGFGLVLLGMGADCHIGAMFPGSPAVAERERLCVAVDRPDGLKGLTLTSPALSSGSEILLIVAGAAKAEAVARAVSGDEEPSDCPARLLAAHPNATFLLDEPAARML